MPFIITAGILLLVLINQEPSSFLGELVVDIATLVIGLYFILFFITLGVNSLMAIFQDGGKTLFRIMKNYAVRFENSRSTQKQENEESCEIISIDECLQEDKDGDISPDETQEDEE